MPPSQQVIQWLNERYPRPCVDREWLDGCVQWLEGERGLSPLTNFAEFMNQVEIQLLESDLVDSMQRGTGLDPSISRFTGNLRGPPVMVQVMDMMEVGSSAFNLEQVRVAREERMRVGEGNVEGDEEGDVEVEGEGPMPKYPRGHLRFKLSDGTTEFDAFEFRPIAEFNIGITPLGLKMHLRGTRFHKGMAMLQTTTMDLLGGRVADMEEVQVSKFKQGLRVRLGRPLSPESHELQRAPPVDNVPVVARSPPHSTPAQHAPMITQYEDDIEMEPQRKLSTSPPNDILSASSNKEKKQVRSMIALPSRRTITSIDGITDENGEFKNKNIRTVTAAERATLVYAGSKIKKTISPYFEKSTTALVSKSSGQHDIQTNFDKGDLDFKFEPTNGQTKRTLPARSSPQPDVPLDTESFNEMDYENQPPKSNKGKGRANAPHKAPSKVNDDSNSSDYGMDDSNDFVDPMFLEDLDKAEKAALSSGGSMPSSHSSSDPIHVATTVPSRYSPGGVQATSSEVIEINDSDDEMLGGNDKENEPVITKHVRQRMDGNENLPVTNPRRSMPESSGNKLPLSQKTRRDGLPLILAKTESDIIDLSDSD